MVMDAGGLPEPELQIAISDSDGLIGRVDFLFREFRTIVEFDGKIKYSRELAPDGDPTIALWREKQREDRLRALGYEVVRITWADLHDVSKLIAKIHAAFLRAERRFGRLEVA
jgi:very-short-patch-repair endonuclease